MMKKLRFIIFLIIISCGSHPDREGSEYATLKELIEAQKEIGFVQIGRFEEIWPAEIIEVKKSMDEIEFVLQNGRKHTYQGFFGYELKAIRLKANENKENLIVFRSREIKY